MSKTKEVVTYYTERAKATPWESMPTIGIDNGIGGKCFEVCTVAEIVKRCNGVKSTGKCDLTFKGTKVTNRICEINTQLISNVSIKVFKKGRTSSNHFV